MVRRGVFTVGVVDAFARGAAALAVLSPAAALGHRTAAALWGWPLRGSPPDRTEVTFPGASARRSGSLVVHSAALTPADRSRVRGLATTAAARTVVDVARQRPFREALVVADAALAAGATSAQDLASHLVACHTWPGIRRAHRVVQFADAGAESPGESLSRIAIAASGLPTPRTQVWVGAADEPIGRVDFLWEAERTVGEFDGRLKYSDPSDLWAEKVREDRFRDAGFEVVRWVWADAYGDFTPTAARIWAAFARAARRG